jgi:hypothetical protein
MSLGRIKQYKKGKVGWITWASHLCCHCFLTGQNIHTIKWNTEAVLVTDKKVDLEVNDEETKYIFMCCEQNVEQNYITNTGNTSFWSVAKFKYLGTSLTIQNCIHDEIKVRLISGNAWYHLVQHLLSSCLLSKNTDNEI